MLHRISQKLFLFLPKQIKYSIKIPSNRQQNIALLSFWQKDKFPFQWTSPSGIKSYGVATTDTNTRNSSVLIHRSTWSRINSYLVLAIPSPGTVSPSSRLPPVLRRSFIAARSPLSHTRPRVFHVALSAKVPLVSHNERAPFSSRSPLFPTRGLHSPNELGRWPRQTQRNPAPLTIRKFVSM